LSEFLSFILSSPRKVWLTNEIYLLKFKEYDLYNWNNKHLAFLKPNCWLNHESANLNEMQFQYFT